MRRAVQGRAGMALAFILGLVIATAGTATAAKLITGKQIKDGSISSKDLSKAVQAQLAKAGAGSKGEPGPKGDAGPPGQAGVAGAAGTARAYGYVSATGAVNAARSANISATNTAAGTFCVTLAAGIDAAKTVAVVTPDFSLDSSVIGDNANQAWAEVGSGDYGCPANSVFVRTGYRSVVTNLMTGVVTNVKMNPHNEPFFIVVP